MADREKAMRIIRKLLIFSLGAVASGAWFAPGPRAMAADAPPVFAPTFDTA